MKKSKWICGFAVMALAVMLSVGCFTVFAADAGAEMGKPEAPEADAATESTGEEAETEESMPEQSAYSYLTGRQNSTNRNDLYAQAEELPEDQRDAFLAENGVGETPWSEDAAASYSYVGGQQRGASYRQGDDADSAQDMSGYSYLTGQQRGSSYHK